MAAVAARTAEAMAKKAAKQKAPASGLAGGGAPQASSSRKSTRFSSLERRRSTMSNFMRSHIYADRLDSTLREGDVIMFKGKHMHDSVIRCCTGSEINHVAMVVRTHTGELELFEAGALGVAQIPLEFYINSYYWSHMSGLFHKVVVRQLYTKHGRGLPRQLRAELMRYQDEMLGRKFTINPVQYMRTLLSIPHKEDMTTSFCSQLVAGAYKRMGLLPEEPAATTYLPRDFTSGLGARLPLTDGARLGRERTLVFDNTPLHARDSAYYASRRTLLAAQPSVPDAAPASPRIGRDRFSDAGNQQLLAGLGAESSIKEGSSESLDEPSQAPRPPKRAPSDSASAATMSVVRHTSSDEVLDAAPSPSQQPQRPQQPQQPQPQQQQQQHQQHQQHQQQAAAATGATTDTDPGRSWKSRAVKRLSIAAGLEPTARPAPVPVMLSSEQAEEMMRDAYALYTLRKWMRRHMREKQRLLSEPSPTARDTSPPPVPLSEVQVEVRN
jgi:hypothetical protein